LGSNSLPLNTTSGMSTIQERVRGHAPLKFGSQKIKAKMTIPA